MSYDLFDMMLAALRDELYKARAKVLMTNGARRPNVSWIDLNSARWKVTWISYVAGTIRAKVGTSSCSPLAVLAERVS